MTELLVEVRNYDIPTSCLQGRRSTVELHPHIWVGVVCSTSLRLTQSAIYHAIETKDFGKSITIVAIHIQLSTIMLSVDKTIFNCLKLIRLLLPVVWEYS